MWTSVGGGAAGSAAASAASAAGESKAPTFLTHMQNWRHLDITLSKGVLYLITSIAQHRQDRF